MTTRPGPRKPQGWAFLFSVLSGFLLLGTGLFGCTSYVSLPPRAIASDAVILTLNGEPLCLEDYDTDFRLMSIHYSAVSEGDIRRMKRYLSERVIDHRLLYQESLRRGVRITRREFEEELRRVSAEVPEDFPLILKGQGVTIEAWKRIILLQLFVAKLVKREVFDGVRITQQEVEDYYWSHLSEFQLPAAVRVRHLVVRSSVELAKVRKRLKEGDSFGQVAVEHSLGAARAEQGEWGWTPLENMSPCFRKALSGLEPGEISESCRDHYGYHVFELLERRPRRLQTLGEARERIHDQLLKLEQGFRFDQWMTGLKEKAVVRVNQEMAPLVGIIPEVSSDQKNSRRRPVRRVPAQQR
jgi:peptidyl-prolyl cis-trans isomerase C